jgi:hypothetical protein
MGFQVGTKIDPRLMAVDYTPLIRANEMAAEQIAGMGKNIGNAISSYQDNKKQDKEFGQIVKSSLAMTDAMMQNLPPEQAEKLARFATDSGVNDLSLPMEQRAQAAQQFGASLGAIMESIGDDEITFQTSPDGSVVATMVDGTYQDTKRTGNTQLNFGGNPTVDPVDSEEARRAARILELEAKQ